MAVQAAPVSVSRMAGVALVAGIFAVVLGVLVARGARDSRVLPRLDVEPIGAMRVAPCILQVALLAIPPRAIGGVRERGAAIGRFVTARAFRRSRHDLECLHVAVTIAALERAVRPHKGKSRLIVIESREAPDR